MKSILASLSRLLTSDILEVRALRPPGHQLALEPSSKRGVYEGKRYTDELKNEGKKLSKRHRGRFDPMNEAPYELSRGRVDLPRTASASLLRRMSVVVLSVKLGISGGLTL